MSIRVNARSSPAAVARTISLLSGGNLTLPSARIEATPKQNAGGIAQVVPPPPAVGKRFLGAERVTDGE